MADPAPERAPAAKALSCPNCGGTITLRAAGYTVTVACEYCASILDVSQPQVRLVTKYQEQAARLGIPLGTRGVLDNIEWEAVGWMARDDSGYPWQEYLLFNPYHGYRWLIGQRGGWSLGEQLTVTPRGGFRGITVDDAQYQPFFADGNARVTDVVGEFYWRVKRGDTVKTDDWVRPGWMLSREADDREVSWSRSRWLPAGTAEAAFGFAPAGKVWPPLPHQPSPSVAFIKQGAMIGAATLLLLIVAAMFMTGTKTLYQGSVEIAADGRDQEATVGPIELTRTRQRVRVAADVPGLSNGWVDLDWTLVNRKDQSSYVASKAAERYSGTDSDGSWSEGSGDASAEFSAIPAGTYDLLIDYKGNNWIDPAQVRRTDFSPFNFGNPVTTDVPDWRRNDMSQPRIDLKVTSGGGTSGGVLFLALMFIGFPLVFGIVAHLNFEAARRGESDFAPSGGDEED